MKANKKVYDAMRIYGVNLYELAHQMNITDGWLCKKLRFELPDDEQEKLITTIQEINSNGGVIQPIVASNTSKPITLKDIYEMLLDIQASIKSIEQRIPTDLHQWKYK